MRRRLCKSLVAVLLIFSVGGHWAFLQSVAWVSMVVQFSQEAPIDVAVAKTFDGKHPCKICKIVKHGKESEEKIPTIKEKTKLDFWVPVRAVVLTLPAHEQDFGITRSIFFTSRGEAPPLPPPRQA